MKRALPITILAALLLGAPALAGGSAAGDTALYREWQTRYAEAAAREQRAAARLETARVRYSAAKHRHRLRGERKREIVAELELAAQRLEDAIRELAEIPQRARQAGVPRGALPEADD